MTNRKTLATELYNEGKIKLDTLGFMSMDNFSDRVINEAYERNYITCGMAGNLLTARV